jgi:hypothetical protein
MPAHYSDPSLRAKRARYLTSAWVLRIAFALLISVILILMLFGTSAFSH